MTLSRMPIVVVGHVDHGKSTVLGRLLSDTGSLPQGRLEQIRELCARTSRPFEYAFLLDALRDERSQGITIDAARIFFRSAQREYVILDAPGHSEFLKNMVTGASRAEAALLVIDVHEGVRENSRRHGFLLGMLGISQVAVLVNKMDLVDFDQSAFNAVSEEFRGFLGQIGLEARHVIPVAARDGDNIATRSPGLAWFDGPTVLEALDQFSPSPRPADLPLRLPVQDVYKFTANGDDRRIIAGSIEAGRLRAGDHLLFYPSGKRSRVRTIEGFNVPPQEHAVAGDATGLTLTEQIYVTRGEVATREGDRPPQVGTRLRTSLFWLGRAPLAPERQYLLKTGTARVPMHLETVHRVIDASSLAPKAGAATVGRHDVAECTLRLARPVAVDPAEVMTGTGRFVIVDGYEIRGGGIVREVLPDDQSLARERVALRNYKWETSFIAPERREERFGQRATLVLVTGPTSVDRKGVGKALEAALFGEGRNAYFLGMGSVVYGVDADLDRDDAVRQEHVRRLAEVAHILLDAGTLLIASAADLRGDEVDLIMTSIGTERTVTVWLGTDPPADFTPAIILPPDQRPAVTAQQLHAGLGRLGILAPPPGHLGPHSD